MNTTADEKVASNPRLVPSTRFTLALLVSFALFVQYSQRVSLSMAIVCMVDKRNLNSAARPTLDSEEFVDETVSVPTKYGSELLPEKQFLWSEFQQQILLGAYWFGYIFTLIPSLRIEPPFNYSSISLSHRRLVIDHIGC